MKSIDDKLKLKHLIHNALVGLVLLLLMIGGCYLIVHNSSWSMDDACMIQARVGSGVPAHVNDFPGFNPKEGRLFPMAYIHTNLILLFSGGEYCSAKPFYVLNAVLWVLFIIQLYLLAYLMLIEKSNLGNIMAKWMSLLVVLVCCQRVFADFTCLWTTISLDEVLTVSFCLMLYLHFTKTKGKRVFGVMSIVLLLYLSFCLELNAAISLMIGIGLIYKRRELNALSASCLSVFLLFVILYVSFILFRTEGYYDSSHGASETVLSNAIKELLLHKLLIVMFLIFIYRLFSVFVRKREYNEFSDTLLLAGVAYTIGGFILRLHGVYYSIPILLSIPAMLYSLKFDNLKNKVLCFSAVLLIGCYYLVKYPKLCKAIYERKAMVCQNMNVFADRLKDEKDIVWYAEELDNGNMDNLWLKRHVVSNLKHLKRDNFFALKTESELIEGVVLLTPNSTDITPLKEKYPGFCFSREGAFAGLLMYRIE